MIIYCLFVYILVLIPLTASQSCDEETGWKELNGNCFRVSHSAPETQHTWQEARATCLRDGGELASLHSQEKQDFIVQLATDIGLPDVHLWIGMNQLDDRQGPLRWSDGSDVGYTNWAASQPMVGGLTHCVYSATVEAATFYAHHFLSYWDHVCVGRSDTINIIGPDDYAHSGVRTLTGGDDYGLWYSANCGLSKALACRKPVGSDTPVTLPTTPLVDSYCPAGYFEGGGNKCYRLVSIPSGGQGVRWDQALQLCRSGPGYYPDLASFHSPEDNARVTAHIQSYVWNYWIGLHYAKSHNSWVWADNTEPLYTNWANGQPETPDKCVEMWSVSGPTGHWASQSCEEPRGYICQTYKDANNIISTPALTTPHDCPPGWTSYWYGCYQYQSQVRTWTEAKMYCDSQDSTLVTIHAEAENAAVYIGVDANFPVWIGLQRNQSSGEYTWVDRWSDYYQNFGAGGQDSGDGCVAMVSSGEWNDTICDNSHVSVCKKTEHPPPSIPPPGDGHCKPNWVKWGYSCYFFSPTTERFYYAMVNCEIIGADLVSIGNQMENDFIKAYMNSQTYLSRAWIGLFRNPTELEYKWVDGSHNEYRNWGPSEPSNPANELCAEVENSHISNYPGYWFDYHCYNYNHYICEAHPEENKKDTNTADDTRSIGSANDSKAVAISIIVMVALGAVIITIAVTVIRMRNKTNATVEEPGFDNPLEVDKQDEENITCDVSRVTELNNV